jgi:hypothetical protein
MSALGDGDDDGIDISALDDIATPDHAIRPDPDDDDLVTARGDVHHYPGTGYVVVDVCEKCNAVNEVDPLAATRFGRPARAKSRPRTIAKKPRSFSISTTGRVSGADTPRSSHGSAPMTSVETPASFFVNRTRPDSARLAHGTRPSRDVDETVTQISATAFHESGHATIARTLGLRVTRVSVEPVCDTFYQTWRSGTTEIQVIGDLARDFSPLMKRRLRAEAISLLAGPIAERFAQEADAGAPEPAPEGDTDLEHATWLLSRDTPPHDLPRELRAARATAERLVRKRWPAIERLAERLTRSREITLGERTRRMFLADPPNESYSCQFH